MSGWATNWMVGSLSPNDSETYMGAPDNPMLLDQPGYVSFAQAQHSRTPQVLFTSNDGILYGIDAKTGVMDWGWMPRPFLSRLKDYTTLQSQQLFNGQLTTTDAVDASGNWASYVVGTAQGGAYHYALKLSSTGTAPVPLAQTWGLSTPGGTTPQGQAPLIITAGGAQYAVFVVNTQSTAANGTTTTVSTLYEVNVATGQTAQSQALSAALPFVASSALSYEPSTGVLWVGDTQGEVWSLNLSGSASADVASAMLTATDAPAGPVQFVGYTEIGDIPYLWAAQSSQIFVYQFMGGQSTLLWSASNTSGYRPDKTGAPQPSSTVMPLHTGGQITIAPQFQSAQGELLLEVHLYVPPSDALCGTGAAYNDYYDFLSGGKPVNPIRDQNGALLTNFDVYVGSGTPLATQDAQTPNGTIAYLGSSLGAGGGGGGGFFAL